jgi:hypothetical protein
VPCPETNTFGLKNSAKQELLCTVSNPAQDACAGTAGPAIAKEAAARPSTPRAAAKRGIRIARTVLLRPGGGPGAGH